MLALVVFVLLLVIAYCLARPAKSLPPPVVALNLISLHHLGTNLLASLSFTNMGQTEVCLWDSSQLYRLVAQTPARILTDDAPWVAMSGMCVPPGSNSVFTVWMPLETTQWQVTTIYGFQKKRHLPSEFDTWVRRSWLLQRSPAPVSDAVLWCLDLLPSGPDLSHGAVRTPVMTNDVHVH